MWMNDTVFLFIQNRIDGVMVSVLASSAVDRGFEPWSGQTKDFKIDICCFSSKHAAYTIHVANKYKYTHA